MGWADSDLDFTVVDRARTLGDLLKLLFALLEKVGPKEVADLLTDFDASFAIDPETAGRWLRNERRPSKQHLLLIVRLLQSRGLIGSPRVKDRLFMRIAAFYAGLDELAPKPMIAQQLPTRRPERPRLLIPGLRFRALRRRYELALALDLDLNSLDGEEVTVRPRTPRPQHAVQLAVEPVAAISVRPRSAVGRLVHKVIFYARSKE